MPCVRNINVIADAKYSQCPTNEAACLIWQRIDLGYTSQLILPVA
jgi:hypothetical protein